MASVEDIGMFFRDLGVFIGTTTLALVAQQLVVLPLVSFCVTRTNPFAPYISFTKAWLIAFATSSS